VDERATRDSGLAGLARRTGVVVVAHARADLALRCVESLASSVTAESMVVVVNAPEAVEPAELTRLRQTVRVVSAPSRQGYGANLNLGVQSLPAGLEFLLLANDDLEFAEGAVEKLLGRLDEDPSIGIVAPALYTPDGSRSWAYAPFPTALGTLLSVAVVPLGRAGRRLAHRAGSDGPAPHGRTADGWVCGAAMLVRAAAFRGVNGFDEDFFLYFEEVDFCFRLRAAGWQIAWDADASALHVTGTSSIGRAFPHAFLQSRRLYFAKRLGRPRLVGLQGAQIVILVAGFVYNLLAATLRPVTARQRFSFLRSRFQDSRLFLLGPRVGASR
jgi:N-acetylglucosaminyl-diphospho-decaprenol L-rhamnosyltransferase